MKKHFIPIQFMKMHGLGNDFVVIDTRNQAFASTNLLGETLADRRFGIGYDQLVLIEDSKVAYAKLVFFNADGSKSATCGNATRCVGRYFLDQENTTGLNLETERGLLECLDAGNGLCSVNMGFPFLDWNNIPLAEGMETLELPLEGRPCAVGMGNPHCVFFGPENENSDIEVLGPKMENHPLFPERTNVEVVCFMPKRDEIRVRVWERGVGITKASGSGACAAAVATIRRQHTSNRVKVKLDGGCLDIHWKGDGVWMTGPTSQVYTGVFSKEFQEMVIGP